MPTMLNSVEVNNTSPRGSRSTSPTTNKRPAKMDDLEMLVSPSIKEELIDIDTDHEEIYVYQPGRSKRPKMAPIHLTREDQEDIVEWYKANPCLYDKGHADYKLTQLKSEMWDEKAKTVYGGQYSGPRLRTWIESLRTQYGKLSKRPVGSGSRVSDREKWILEKLSFLSRHIYRVARRSGVDLMSKYQGKHSDRTALYQHSNDAGDREDDGEYESSTESQDYVKRNSVEPVRLQEVITEPLQVSDDWHDRLLPRWTATPSTIRTEERHRWGQWYGAAIYNIDDSLWGEFQTASLQLVESFRQRSRTLQRPEQHHNS